MNGIEKITDRIASDAQNEANALLKQAQEQSASILASYDALSQAKYDETVARGKVEAADRVERLKGVAQLDARNLALKTRQEMLDAAFQKAYDNLLALPEDEYVALLTKLALDACETGHEALIFSTTDRPRFGKKVVIAANEKLAAAGKEAALTLSEEAREFKGGLYIKNGNIENNCTFATIIRMLRQNMAGEVAKILFD